MKLENLKEEAPQSTYNHKVIEWYFCDSARKPILFDSKTNEIRVCGVMKGGQNDGKTITTSPIVKVKNNSGNYMVTTQSGNNYSLTLNDIKPRYKATLQLDMLDAILANIK